MIYDITFPDIGGNRMHMSDSPQRIILQSPCSHCFSIMTFERCNNTAKYAHIRFFGFTINDKAPQRLSLRGLFVETVILFCRFSNVDEMAGMR